MTIEDFILLCKLKGWHDTASFIERVYHELRESCSEEMLDHLKRRKHA